MSFGITASSVVTALQTAGQSVRWAQASAQSSASSSVTFAASGAAAPHAGDVLVIIGSRDDQDLGASEWNLALGSLGLSIVWEKTYAWAFAGAFSSSPLTSEQAVALAGTTIVMDATDDNAFVAALLSGTSGQLDGVPSDVFTSDANATNLSVPSFTTSDDNEIVLAGFDVGTGSGVADVWSVPTGFTRLDNGVNNNYHSFSAFYDHRPVAGATGPITSTMPTGATGQVVAGLASAFAFRSPEPAPGFMPSMRGWTNTNSGRSGTVTFAVPEGTTDGDILVLMIAGNGAADTGNFSLPSGFTRVDWSHAAGSAPGSTSPLLIIATKTAASEPSSYTTFADTNCDTVAALVVVRDSAGLDAYSSILNYSVINSSSIVTQGLTTQTTNCLVLQGYTMAVGTNHTPAYFTGPAGSQTLARGIQSRDDTSTTLGMFAQIEPSIVSNKTYTATSMRDQWPGTAIALAFKPVATGDSPYATAVLNDSPLVYLPFSEKSGTTAADISGNSHNATYSGPSLFLGGYSIVSESAGRSVWAGGADLVTVPYGAWMDTSGMTALFSCFAQPGGIVLWAARYPDDGDLSQDAWFVDVNASGRFDLWFHTSDGTSVRIDSGVSPTPGTRYFVAAYVGASESGIRVYSENGTLVGANTGVGGSLNMPSADITLFGMGGTTVYGVQGCMDDFSLFDHALTTTRLDELAALALSDNHPWISRTEGTGVRNGTNTHTLTFAPASAGSLLVAVMGGPVTHTAVTSGWTKQISALDNTELAVFTHTAAGGETTLDVTHNAGNYPITWVVYEFPAGSSYHSGSSVSGGGISSGLDLAGLPGSKVTVMVAQNSALLPAAATLDTNWRFYWETDTNLNVLNDGTTDGTWLNIGYFAHNDFPDTTVSITDVSLYDGLHYEQAVLFAILHP